MRTFRQTALALAMVIGSVTGAQAIDVNAAVVRVDYQTVLPISRFDYQPDDLGFAGALLAEQDNATTGSFLGHTYETVTVAAPPEGAAEALAGVLDQGIKLVVVLARRDDLLALTEQADAAGALVFNARAKDNDLRSEACQGNLLHTAPSHGQEADAVAQFALWKKWDDWLLVSGSNPVDVQVADAYRHAARKFGAKIVEERVFEDTGGSRRSDSGHVLVQRQLPVFMQDTAAHDVVVAADGSDYFAGYLPYHLWTPRPVIGSAGLRAVQMHGGHEAYGATQFQTRFEKLAGRYVKDEDYNAWAALRAVGEAVTRANTAEPDGVRDYLLSDDFELAGFKGQALSFRSWNGQMRQQMILSDGRITVSVSPQDGFLHRTSPQDTMGLDAPESKCTEFQ